jgi:hypothetical protein
MDTGMTELDLSIAAGYHGKHAICRRVKSKTIEAEHKAMNLHRVIADNGFSNRAVVHYQLRMAAFDVKGL